VIASEPSTAGLYRLDTLIAAGARRSLWLTDAYFVGTTAYTQALVAAARDEVDVRLLVPGSSDLVLIRALSRAGYRPLLAGGGRGRGQGSAGRAVAGALGIGNAVGAALTNRRTLGPAEAKLMMSGGLTLLAVAMIAVFWPRLLTVPLAVFSVWVAVGLLGRAY